MVVIYPQNYHVNVCARTLLAYLFIFYFYIFTYCLDASASGVVPVKVYLLLLIFFYTYFLYASLSVYRIQGRGSACERGDQFRGHKCLGLIPGPGKCLGLIPGPGGDSPAVFRI